MTARQPAAADRAPVSPGLESAVLAQNHIYPYAFVALRPGGGHWRIFHGLATTLRLTGNRVPEAFHAALAMEHGCEWITLDRGFAAYPGLRLINLLDLEAP